MNSRRKERQLRAIVRAEEDLKFWQKLKKEPTEKRKRSHIPTIKDINKKITHLKEVIENTYRNM
jgi:hypothetical protein